MFTAERSRTRRTTDSPNCVGRVRDAQIDLSSGERDGDAAVLRQPPLRDVEVGHDLDARGHRQGQIAWRRVISYNAPSTRVTDLEFVLETVRSGCRWRDPAPPDTAPGS